MSRPSQRTNSATIQRVALAFFAGDGAKAACRNLRERRALRNPQAPNTNRKTDPYAHLALPDESILVADIDNAHLGSVIDLLQGAGARSIFLTNGRVHPLQDVCVSFGKSSTHAAEIQNSIDSLQSRVRSSRDYLVDSGRLGHLASPAAQWMIDNAYLIDLTLSELRKDIPAAFKNSKLEDVKRLMASATQLIGRCDARITEEVILQFLSEIQQKEELDSVQLWSFPLLLRASLIEVLTQLACRASRIQQLREIALLWADRLTASAIRSSALLEQMVARLRTEPFASDRSFAVALTEQLQDQETALDVVHSLIEAQSGKPLAELVRAEHEREAADSLLASNAFGSLKSLAQIDYKHVFEAVSRAEAVLQNDPACVYARSAFTTRDHARQVVARIARQSDRAESEVARQALTLAFGASENSGNGVLYYLIGEGVEQLECSTGARIEVRQRILRGLRRHATGVYIGSILSLTAGLLSAVLSIAWDERIQQPFLLVVLGVLASLPLSELAIQIIHSLLINTFPPEPLPKMDFRLGIPDEAATLVVVPMMLSNASAVRTEAEKLEIRYLANPERNLSFALFTDFVDATEPSTASDAGLLKAAKEAIARLNLKYPDARFLLFHRSRSWSNTQQQWIGRERKRGKIEDLTALLAGHGDPALCVEGNIPSRIAHVITLDADTRLPPGTAKRLIETIAHPLNRVELDPKTGIRKRGFAIIQPRISIALPGANATRFTRIFSDAHGTDPYCTVVSDAQQDLFLEGMFHGKAIFNVEMFDRILRHRFPPETLLSHDLIEGAHVGVGFASDIDLLENLPLDYPSFAKRQHRWIRGDWQIASWATSRVLDSQGQRSPNPLALLNRWRIFDNLRRSLVPVASLLLVGFGWFFSVTPAVWSVLLALTAGIPAIVPILDRWTRQLEGSVYGWQGAADDLQRAGVMAAFLPHQAWLAIDAIARVLHRRFVSKRHLLEWQTAEAADSFRTLYAETTLRQMVVIAVVSAIALFFATLNGSLAPAVGYLGIWMAAPWLLTWLEGSGPARWNEPLGRTDLSYLRLLARRTWRYFDDLVGEQTNWLPPDNSQLALRVEVATRTSPTNIGLWLNSAIAAQDLGYLTTRNMVQRCNATFATLNKLQRYEGHLLNWYDTQTLQPLLPQYVSTVDSGNLIASLWVLSQACSELAQSPVLGSATIAGFADSITCLESAAGTDPSVAVSLRGLRRTVRGQVDGIERIGQVRLASFHSAQLKTVKRWSPQLGDEKTYWAVKQAGELDTWTDTIDLYLSWMELLSGPSDELVRNLGEAAVGLRREALRKIPSLQDIADGPPGPVATLLTSKAALELRPEVTDWLNAVDREYEKARENARTLIQEIEALRLAADQFASGINMGFLYDSTRRLFGIGYAVGNPHTFNSHYDLLASECRLASLVSIAKGDIPIEHWFVLGRPRMSTPARHALLSWSGTMFEYLMPLLFTEPYQNTLLAHACEAAVDVQIAYGEESKVPWGVSEAAYSALDSNQIYQYRAFGVPGLALNPNADPGPVIAPYATVLSLMVRPQEAVANLRRLDAEGLSGSMGFYESIDYTRPRRKGEQLGVPIFAYMAHHQGMSLLALSNMLSKKTIRRRFHADLRVRAVESLLFERIPITRVEREEIPVPATVVETTVPPDRRWTKSTLSPRVHMSSNGHYSVMVTNNGGGYSRWNGFDITRWQSDGARDDLGTFLWIKDLRSGACWSPAPQPAGYAGESSVTFSSDRAEFTRRVLDLEAKLEIAVATDDAELRRVTITNRSLRTRNVELTSYAELALAPHAADMAHPAFSKMFVETELLESGVLIAHRRLRAPEDAPIWMASMLVGHEGTVEHETDRRAFIGRGRSRTNPAALTGRLTGTTGAVLDPIHSFRHRMALEPRDQKVLCFICIAAPSREELLAIIRKYQRPDAVTRAFDMIWTRSQLEFRYLRIGPATAHRYQDLAGYLLYPNPRLRVRSLSTKHLGQKSLWRYGISGDLPILALSIADDQGEGLVREVLVAHAYWRMLGMEADVVILNRETPGYDLPLRKSLDRLLHSHGGLHGSERSGKIYLLDWWSLPKEDQTLILTTASVVLSGHLGPLQQQLLISSETQPDFVFPGPPGGLVGIRQSVRPALDSQHKNGLGDFSAGGKEYVIDLAAKDDQTPAPWANVIANSRFGTVVTESGLGFTWSRNSQMNRLTPWHNDPVSDPQSEVLYLRDEDTGDVWTPTPLPMRGSGSYRVRHGQGYSTYESRHDDLEQVLTVFAAAGDPVKVALLRVTNHSTRKRRLTATYFAEWTLGSLREQQQLHIDTSFHETESILFASQSWTDRFAGTSAFLASRPHAASFSGNRGGFLGRSRTWETPSALQKERLDNRTGVGLDPCGAMQVAIEIPSDEYRDVVFLLGEAESESAALEIVQRYSDSAAAERELQSVLDDWERRLSVVQVHTPDPETDAMLNRWLLYQSLSCRIWARSAIYQSGGAIGFRDQLQDCLALIYTSPALTRSHILRAAARQFPEGDVQHWWHADSGLGVRTRCSDDLLWLPWVVSRYLQITGDKSILEDQVQFVEGPALEEHESEKMFLATISPLEASLREHCIRAIEHASRFGSHGLPLIGNGDWNDGMNHVGVEGRGESVWLAWFLLSVLDQWAPIVEEFDTDLAARFRRRATTLTDSVHENGWDGDWYLRGYFDDGTPLGSHADTEARIDGLPQAWAVLSGRGTRDRDEKALASAKRLLFKPDDGLVLLFTPPFDKHQPHPGYIMGYPPGTRENGGQYTHGALWLAQAMARNGDADGAIKLLNTINPAMKATSPEQISKYRGEPYAIAADVSSSPLRPGAAGWTWYTGSAAWMYRIWLEDVLGFELHGNVLHLKPMIPERWPGFSIDYRYGTSVWHIQVERLSSGSARWAEADGLPLEDCAVPLTDDGTEHSVKVWLGSESAKNERRTHFAVKAQV